MKLQHLAVIFVVIVVPISMVLSMYIDTQIDAIVLQTQYTSNLNTATYDALKAYQINTNNNRYSSVSDSKIRDIEASINTFYTSLVTAMESTVATQEDLEAFIPAILFTQYDGYYIYSASSNVYETNEDGTVSINTDNKDYEDGLSSYIYYSCKYKLANGNIVVVNYTLDNAITVYGDVGDGNGYQTKSGYLINYEKVTNVNNTKKTLKYDNVTIEPETLTEYLITVSDDGTITEGNYNYIVYNNERVYKDTSYEIISMPEYDSNGNLQYENGTIKYKTIYSPKFFWYNDGEKTYLESEMYDFIEYLTDNHLMKLSSASSSNYSYKLVNDIGYKSISAYEYYTEAVEFSEWIYEYLGELTQDNILHNENEEVVQGATYKDGELYLSVDTDNLDGATKYIFAITDDSNNPLLSDSTFNQHRLAVIRKSIETSLTSAIASYNAKFGTSGYEFSLPVIDENYWYQIGNNTTIITFMQGLTLGYKYYNNYAVITNTQNQDVINAQSVYILAKNSDGTYTYHQAGCSKLLSDMISGDIDDSDLVAYSDTNFERQTVEVSEGNYRYFYPQARSGTTTTGCYYCIVNSTTEYDIDDIIAGNDLVDSDGNVTKSTNQCYIDLRQAYLMGLARERYDLYKSNFD